MPYIVYILYSSNIDRLYIGQTSNLENRVTKHNSGESPYTYTGIPWTLLWKTQKSSLRSAEDLEFKLKNLSRITKIKFMRKYSEGIHDKDLLNRLALRNDSNLQNF